MTQTAERQETYVERFDVFRRGPAAGPEPVRRARDAAFQRFRARGFPTTRDEEWRFTNIGPIAETAFAPDVPSAAGFAPGVIEALAFDGALPVRAVVVNGQFSARHSTLGGIPAGVIVRGLREALAAPGPGAAAWDVETPASHAFVDLNTAFFEDGVLIEIAPGTIVAEPLLVLFVSAPGDAPRMISPRLVIVAGERSQVSIVEAYAGVGVGQSLTNAVTDVRVGPGAVVDHMKLQRESPEAFHLASTFARIERAGTFTSTSMAFGGRIVRNDILATLDGDGAECTLNGLYVPGGDSLLDNHTTIDHARPHCPSHELYKGILTGRSRAVFNGKIIVRPDAQKTNAKQTNKALLLTDDAQINTKPQLEIFADDVKCTHGAAIGQLDEDALFYFRARGIAEADARNFLIHAFAGEVLDRVSVPAVRACAERLMAGQLQLG
jgi:Fe-S cluster assembly protein SufD